MGYNNVSTCCHYEKVADNDHHDVDDDDDLTKLERGFTDDTTTTTTTTTTTMKPTKSFSKHYRSKKRSACTWCLYVTAALFGLFLLLSTMAVIAGYTWTKHQVIRFTSTNPGDALPIQPLPAKELELVKDRVKLFVDTILADQIPTPQDLILTQQELNGFLAHSDYFRGNAFVRIINEQQEEQQQQQVQQQRIHGTSKKSSENNNSNNNNDDGNNHHAKLFLDMSLPVDNLPGGKGRYFVAAAYLDIQHLDANGDNNKDDNDDESQNAAWVTTDLDTKYSIPDLDNDNLSLWHAEMTMYWQNEKETQQQQQQQQHHHREQKTLVMNVEHGNFLHWIVPQDFVDQRQNLMDYILYNDDDDDHDHDCEMVRKIVQGIDSVTLEEGRIVIHASPFLVLDNEDDDNVNDEKDDSKHHRGRALLAADQQSFHHQHSGAVKKLLWKLLN